MQVGYALICEEHGPRELVANARLAEQEGFAFLSLSDHFHPWLPSQGQSPFAWTVMGALLEATSLPVITQVTCPIKRYHPAIVAQAAATAAAMGPGRVTLGLGTGEALNEHVVGGAWPAPSVRLEMLDEAIEMIVALWSGRPVTMHGRFATVDSATLYTLPESPPELAVAAGGSTAMELAARHGHLISTGPDPDAVRAYRSADGQGKVYGQASFCFAEDRDTAQPLLLERWRHSAFGWDVNAELPTPAAFEQATAPLTTDAIIGSTPLGSDPDAIGASLDAYRDAGFDAVSMHNIGPNQQEFLQTVGGWLRDGTLGDG